MEPQLYLEFETNLQTVSCEEWLGREYGRVDCPWGNGDYPIPPYSSPNTPPFPEEYTWWYSRAKMKAAAGGVIVLDDDIMRFATQPQVLSNGQEYFVDLTIVPVEYAALSEAGKAALAPPPPEE